MIAGYNGKELYVGDKSLTFEFEIRTVIEMGNNNIVLLSIPFKRNDGNSRLLVSETKVV